MAAVAAAVRPVAGGVSRCAATAPFDARERVSGKKRPRVGAAPSQDSKPWLTKMIRQRNNVVTAAGEMSSQEPLQKRLASELDALHGLVKKAELISRGGGARKGGAPTAERFLASNSKQRPKPIQEDFNAQSVKKRKVSTPVEQRQKQIPAPPRMSPEGRNQLACRLSSLSGKLPGHIVEFMEKQFGDADSHGEVEINMDTVEDSVLLELKTRLDKFAEESKDNKLAEESKDGKVAEESKDDKVDEEEGKGKKEAEEYADISIGLSCIIGTGGCKPSSSSSGGSDTRMVQQSFQAKKIPDAQQCAAPKAVDMRGLLYRANLRRQLVEMERTVVPDQRIHPRDLQRLGIKEYGHPSIMRQLGLVVKASA